MNTLLGCLIGFVIWFLARYLVGGLYTVNQNERAVKTSFGRAQRVGTATTLDDPISDTLSPNQRERYVYPQVRVIQPGGPYFKWPWETVHKVSIATETVNIGWDPEDARANNNGTMLEAVTKDQHRPYRPAAVPRRRAQPVRLPVRHQEALCPHHGLFRFSAARADRQLRSAAGRQGPRWWRA
jgi:regulator of protease activity HflC (stomatin/prohibitin superfamily)